MSSPTGSRRQPFGEQRRPHPVLKLGAATLGSLGVIVAGGMFLSEAVSHAAANAPPPKTERQVWYVPAAPAVATAIELDIARSVPVKADLRAPVEPSLSVFTHKVGVESLRVRSGPNKSTDQLFALRGGTAVKLGADRNGWVEITTEDGRRGWVFQKFLSPREG